MVNLAMCCRRKGAMPKLVKARRKKPQMVYIYI